MATENDTVYAFDPSYQQVWTQPRTPSPPEERQCGDIDPLGITGTPVYRRRPGDVYLVAEHSGAVRHDLFALDLHTGRSAGARASTCPE